MKSIASSTLKENYRGLSEREMVMKIYDNDMDAFLVLIAKHQEKIFSFIHKRLSTANYCHAEDIFQDMIIRILKHLREGKYDANQDYFSTWVISVAKNLIYDFFRNRKRNPSYMAFPVEEMHIVADVPGTEKRCLQGNTKHVLRSCINKLPLKDKELVLDRYDRDLSYKAMAEKRNAPIGTIKGSYFRARQKLSQDPLVQELRN